jgi:hypothetical protein
MQEKLRKLVSLRIQTFHFCRSKNGRSMKLVTHFFRAEIMNLLSCTFMTPVSLNLIGPMSS